MSGEELRRVALEHGGYATPSLNDTLYLHGKGYRSIANLDEYTNLASLWLQSNGFVRIEGLDNLPGLRCLFLQQNAFTRIEGLARLTSLVQLDLSDNSIRFVEGLSHLPHLATLNLSKNVLEDASSIAHLKECRKLSALDLSKNSLEGGDVVACLAGIATLTSLNLEGNPLARKVAHLRKKVIINCKNLRYLDRPVFAEERAAVEAWEHGGAQAEKDAKASMLQSKRDAERAKVEEFRAWQRSVRGTPLAFAPAHEVAVGGEERASLIESSTPWSTDDEETETPPDIEFSVKSIANLQEEENVTCVKALSENEDCTKDATAISDIEEDGPSDDSPPEDFHGASTTLEQRARVIRDSLSAMRSRKQSDAQMGLERSEHLLKKLAAKHDYNWSKVALEMKHEFGAEFADEDALERRHALLSLSAGTDEMEVEGGDPGAFHITTTTTAKPLSAYLNKDGMRKSFEDVLEASDDLLDGSDEERPEANRPLSLPSSNAANEDDDVSVIQEENLWLPSSTSLLSPGRA